jgi:acetyl-CoA carboxylase carboxyltransferase component
MYRSFSRVRELVPSVVAILERRLRHRDALVHLADASMRARLNRLAAATQRRYQIVADLAREVRFSYLDDPILATATLDEYSIVDGHLDALMADPERADGTARVDRLVASPEPLRGTLLRRWLSTADQSFRRLLLEVYVRRYYRIRALRQLSCDAWMGQLICSAEYEFEGRQIHLVVGYAPHTRLSVWSAAVAAHLAGAAPDDGTRAPAVPGDREIVVDVTAWREDEGSVGDQLVTELTELLGGCDFGRRLHRLDVTVTPTSVPTAHGRPRHVTFRQVGDATYIEERLYRDLHPMLAKRLATWRLGNFELERLPSPEDVYLFHGVARDNPADHRLFALAEVRDLTQVPGPVDETAPMSYPRLELMGMRALSAMRLALNRFPEGKRPAANRIVLEIRPPWTVPAEAWPAFARSLAPLAVGAGLEKVVLRVRIPEPTGIREAVLHVSGLGGSGLTVRERPVGHAPIRSLTPYRQKVLRAQRFGAPYPYELIRMLTPPADAVGRFPSGSFTEYDLDKRGALVQVERLPGLNTANVVTGVIVNRTTKVPEGMTRVVVLGDPTSGLGNLAEPECRRIIAALDLAERLRVPLEWFAVSSGARIAMDSGTENMDWIAAVLRRLIEFTQRGGEVNVVVTGVNVGAQPYWNAEATMLLHTRGILVMTPESTMVLTGKQALDFSGGVSAEDNFGIGGFDRIMGPNGQGQYWAPTVEDGCAILFAHYDHTFVVPGERYPRRAVTRDPVDRDVRREPHPDLGGDRLVVIGDVFSAEHNPDRKKPFDIRAVMAAVSDADATPLERWMHWRGADTAVVWDVHIGGIPVCLLGVEAHAVNRHGFVPADGPQRWNAGTLFPQSSRKLARAVNAASGNRPLVMLANLSGFDGSPESMRHWQLEYGAEIGRAVTNFRGPIVFVVVSRYHGGAFVVFSKRLNERMEVAAVEGSFASVIGGAPAAAAVFAREVAARTDQDPRVRDLRDRLAAGAGDPAVRGLRALLAETAAAVRSEKLGELAAEFDRVHTIQRALAVGSIDRIISVRELRPYLVDALERGMAGDCEPKVTAESRPARHSRQPARQ